MRFGVCVIHIDHEVTAKSQAHFPARLLQTVGEFSWLNGEKRTK
jgi:hypothetical protein